MYSRGVCIQWLALGRCTHPAGQPRMTAVCSGRGGGARPVFSGRGRARRFSGGGGGRGRLVRVETTTLFQQQRREHAWELVVSEKVVRFYEFRTAEFALHPLPAGGSTGSCPDTVGIDNQHTHTHILLFAVHVAGAERAVVCRPHTSVGVALVQPHTHTHPRTAGESVGWPAAVATPPGGVARWRRPFQWPGQAGFAAVAAAAVGGDRHCRRPWLLRPEPAGPAGSVLISSAWSAAVGPAAAGLMGGGGRWFDVGGVVALLEVLAAVGGSTDEMFFTLF